MVTGQTSEADGRLRLLADPVTGVLFCADPVVLPPLPGRAGGTTEERLRRLLTDPVRRPRLDAGVTRYRPPAVLRRHVWLRDGTCVFPAHHHRAVGTELVHSIPFGHPAGGRPAATSDANLGSTCKRGHNAHTRGGWRVAQPRPGTFIWTSPTGRVYVRRARRLLPRAPGDEDDGE